LQFIILKLNLKEHNNNNENTISDFDYHKLINFFGLSNNSSLKDINAIINITLIDSYNIIKEFITIINTNMDNETCQLLQLNLLSFTLNNLLTDLSLVIN
jgi:hypothetical protein